MNEDTPTEPKEYHVGVIQATIQALADIPITIEQTDTQGELRDKGVFDVVHHTLLLPASYSILAIYFRPYQFQWDICVESPDLLVIDEGDTIPVLSLTYTRVTRDDNTVYAQLEEISSGDTWKKAYHDEQLIVEMGKLEDLPLIDLEGEQMHG